MKKIIITTLLLIMIASVLCTVFAAENDEILIKDLGDCGALLTYEGVPKPTSYVGYEKDGKIYPAYCLNIELLGVGHTDEYSVIEKGKIKDERVWKAIINGFPYKTLSELGVETEKEAFVATKNAVFTVMYNRDPQKYAPVDSDSGRRTYSAYLKIMENAQSSTEVLQDKIETSIEKISSEWIIDGIDKNYVSKTYKLNSNVNLGYYRIELEGDLPEGMCVTDLSNNMSQEFSIGNEFKILIPIQKLEKEGTFKIKAFANVESKPIIYGATTVSGTQDYALTGYEYEESINDFEENFLKNDTSLRIIKKENGTENRLVGVKFNLLDENQNIVKENLETDQNGEILLDNMIPGKYYIKEIETLAGFNLYEDLVEVNLELNKVASVTINNNSKETPEKEDDKEEFTPTYTEIVEKMPEVSNVNSKTVLTKEMPKLPVTGY